MYKLVSAAKPVTYTATMATTAQTNALYVDISVVCRRCGASQPPLVCCCTTCVHICTSATLPENPSPKNAANAALELICAASRSRLLSLSLASFPSVVACSTAYGTNMATYRHMPARTVRRELLWRERSSRAASTTACTAMHANTAASR